MPKPDKPAPSVKHPHVRGEDPLLGRGNDAPEETPPRAWGRHKRRDREFEAYRNTPTCVGKTFPVACAEGFLKKHPHVRGEDLPQV